MGEPAGEHEVHRAPGESSLQLRSIVGRSVDVYREASPSVIRAPSNDNGLRAESHLETGGRCVDQADIARVHQRVGARGVARPNDLYVARQRAGLLDAGS